MHNKAVLSLMIVLMLILLVVAGKGHQVRSVAVKPDQPISPAPADFIHSIVVFLQTTLQ